MDEEELVDNDDLETQDEAVAEEKVEDTTPMDENEEGENVIPATDDQAIPMTDGQIPIPQDSSGIAAGEYGAPSPIGQEQIQFEKGNWAEIGGLADGINQKSTMLTRQVAPLIEVALIELLGQSNSYKRISGTASLAFVDNEPKVSFALQYEVPMWIGTDVKQESALSDAQYVLQKIRLVKGVQVNQCAINTSTGSLIVSGQI